MSKRTSSTKSNCNVSKKMKRWKVKSKSKWEINAYAQLGNVEWLFGPDALKLNSKELPGRK